MSDRKTPATNNPPLGAPVEAHLGEKLREFYDSILSEPVPDKLTALLDQLERQERASLAAKQEGETK